MVVHIKGERATRKIDYVQTVGGVPHPVPVLHDDETLNFAADGSAHITQIATATPHALKELYYDPSGATGKFMAVYMDGTEREITEAEFKSLREQVSGV